MAFGRPTAMAHGVVGLREVSQNIHLPTILEWEELDGIHTSLWLNFSHENNFTDQDHNDFLDSYTTFVKTTEKEVNKALCEVNQFILEQDDHKEVNHYTG